ncbi:phosphotransferase [Deinococcus radiotolerans]|uniref:Aminoglycoside phosphotransferase domain-containing protein n=1 Tax=Deinococcus radiotolerans TaxID=1309407 RepID=A0ABQ2FIN6_9DEIO|nr:phosphotransferase [Deinococcus radiotolerans]GGK98653.1 hypothetical protein GCM10010844_16100 [Deinococcus radiotolerans]
MSADLNVAREVLGPGARFLARGATCVVFTDGLRVLRAALSGEARLIMQAEVQRALGSPAAPVRGQGVTPDGRTWVLEPHLRGDDIPPAPAGWADLGRALAALHALPGAGWGRLMDRPGPLRGEAATPEDGVRSRLPDVWPLGPTALADQALIRAAPGLLGPVQGQRDAVRAAVRGPVGALHTDLHGGQLLWRGGRLLALLDFGDAARGPLAWDLASAAFFHGWAAAAHVTAAAGEVRSEDVAAFGLLLAQHRAARVRHAQALERAVTFARDCLRRLPPGDLVPLA